MDDIKRKRQIQYQKYREYYKQYYKNYPIEKKRTIAKRYYQANKEKKRKNQRMNYQKNREYYLNKSKNKKEKSNGCCTFSTGSFRLYFD